MTVQLCRQASHLLTHPRRQVTLAAENTEYVSLMRGVELVMSDPGSRDLPVSFIFTHDMFLDLRQELADQVRHHPETFECFCSNHHSAYPSASRRVWIRLMLGVGRRAWRVSTSWSWSGAAIT